MKLTYYGHSCFGAEMKGKHILFDPFISPNELAKDINIDEIRADYLLVSHGHGDHVADAVSIGSKNNSRAISNFEIVSWFEQKGVHGHPMNHGGKVKFDFGVVKYVNAVHSSVLPDGTYGGNPGGFVIWNDEVCFYFSGDTALTMDLKLIPMTCPALDFAILPIGDNFTMGYDDAIMACDFIGCDKVIGCHYDTFGYIKIDQARAKKAFEDKGKELILLPIGESLDL
ncbi:MAG: metal-dependent hydrolase [Phaeodactylibacter sp.]|nr:metal-dependent hydrolase [Phaeodactylibacter sp.]MCB9274918.1 metal-dependent hydrolase [Lewinellaceae bacterium]